MRVLVAGALLVAALIVTLALPVTGWRTGDQGLARFDSVVEQAAPPFPRRVWIDTDAACGHSARTDPDDCFALALLLRAPEVEIAGISTVAGNAPLGVVQATTRAIAGDRPTDLRAALEQGPLTILALGPLTNIAAVLETRPDLRKHVARLIGVMGRRPGHLFHPAEGAGGGMLFGHGPVFRDFNFALDPEAAAKVLEMRLPISLVPYDAARGIEITAADLDRLEATIPWIVRRSRGWLEYWRSDIGRQGFYPFDLLAAAYAVDPSTLRCKPARAWVGEDPTLFGPWSRAALLVEPGTDAAVLYCGRTRGDVRLDALRRLTQGAKQ
jgi:purine nucleosidase